MSENARLTQFKPGEFWLILDPMRVVRIVEETVIEVPRRDGSGMDQRRAVYVRATIPCFTVPGHITEKQVKEHRLILKAVKFSNKGDAPDDEWGEIWSERLVYPLKQKEGFTIVDDSKGATLPQAYVAQELERQNPRKGSHIGRAVHGVKLDTVPPKTFRSTAGRTAAPEPEQEAADAGQE